jgi:hypothetical protein
MLPALGEELGAKVSVEIEHDEKWWRKNNFQTWGALQTFSKRRRCQKNVVRKIKDPRLTPKWGRGVLCF